LVKIPDLFKHSAAGVRGPAILAAVFAAVAAIAATHVLTRWFKHGNLIPFAVYCLIFGLAMVIYNA
jgi:undecaprenyl-diphosphatase